MSRMTAELAERIVAGWRSGADTVDGWDNPAGPLFAGGEYAEADITMESIFAASGCTGVGCPPPPESGHCGTACTWSAGLECC
ncbi:DUF6229 family protein [Actinomadura sp. ATCC 31491]|uniref:DUF6229 family protein n=1 Tax=Actinomadura luzonensis TaxID=2805427 RepID=A0ABT0G2E4_9ACTN|nr:DUF6229 family protein [Actinomadura luzonensis]MCK2218786.1 DUF6229 family protein [Actinomadura luzonensis]